MLSIFRMRNSSVNYYTDLARYYRGIGDNGDHDPPDDFAPAAGCIITSNSFTLWLGQACHSLGLNGSVSDEDFEALCRGVHPRSGENLVQNAGKGNRCPGWDLTFSTPKSVSMLWAAAAGERKAQLISMHDRAVWSAVAKLERELAFCRRGKGGNQQEAVKICCATWRDYISRELEPQLHTHATLINLGLRADGQFGALHSPPFFKYKKALGAWYRASLAENLAALGLDLETDGTSFRIVGVPQELCDDHSTRRKQILRACHKDGQYDAVKAARAAKATRRVKHDIPPLEQLERSFRRACLDFGFSDADAEALFKLGKSRSPDLERLVQKAIAQLSSQKVHFQHKDMLFAALVAAGPTGVGPESIENVLTDVIASSVEVLPLEEDRYSTKVQLTKENRLLTSVDKLKRTEGAAARPEFVAKELEANDENTFEQIAAIVKLTQSNSSVRFLSGAPGTGKTSRVLKQVASIYRKSGYEVVALAPTGKAAQQIEAEIPGINSQTLARGLGNWKLQPFEKTKHAAKETAKEAMKLAPFMPKMKHRKPRKPRPIKFGKKKVIIIDEASMVSFDEFQQIADKASREGGTVIFCGDAAQLGAIDSVSPFSFFARTERDTRAVLKDNQRQNAEWQREVIRRVRVGDREALKLLRDHGCLVVEEDRESKLNAVVEDWCQFGIQTPHRASIVATTNVDVEAINRACQRKRVDAGILDVSNRVSVVDKTSNGVFVNEVFVGDRVLFTRNYREIRNGNVGTVVAIKSPLFGHTRIAVKLDSGKTVLVRPGSFQHIRLGYCTTDYRSQGATYENVYVASVGNAESLFVSLSRGRERIKLFATSEEVASLENVEESLLASRMSQQSDLRLACEFLPQGLEFAPPGFKTIERETLGSRSQFATCKSPDSQNRDSPNSNSAGFGAGSESGKYSEQGEAEQHPHCSNSFANSRTKSDKSLQLDSHFGSPTQKGTPDFNLDATLSSIDRKALALLKSAKAQSPRFVNHNDWSRSSVPVKEWHELAFWQRVSIRKEHANRWIAPKAKRAWQMWAWASSWAWIVVWQIFCLPFKSLAFLRQSAMILAETSLDFLNQQPAPVYGAHVGKVALPEDDYSYHRSYSSFQYEPSTSYLATHSVPSPSYEPTKDWSLAPPTCSCMPTPDHHQPQAFHVNGQYQTSSNPPVSQPEVVPQKTTTYSEQVE